MDKDKRIAQLEDEVRTLREELESRSGSHGGLAEAATEENNIRLSLLLDASASGLWNVYIENAESDNPVYHYAWSERFRNMLGFSGEDDFPNAESSWSDRLHPEDRERVLRAYYLYLNQRNGVAHHKDEYRIAKRNGEYIYVQDICSMVRDAYGRALNLIGALRDITELKDAEQKLIAEKEHLRLEKERLQTLGDCIPNGVLFQYILNTKTGVFNFEYVSAQWEEVMGFSKDFALQDRDNSFAYVHPDDLPVLMEKIEHSARTLTLFEYEHRNVVDGRDIWVHMLSHPRRENDNIIWNGIAINTTARKETERQLKLEKERLQLLGDNLPYGTIYRYAYDMDAGTQSIPYVSAGWERVMGYSAEIALNDLPKAFTYVHPDDLQRLTEAFEHSRVTMTLFDIEFRMVYNGVVRWVRKTAHPRYEGRMIFWDGIGIDITERKEAQKKLLAEKERLETLGNNIPYGALYRCVLDTETNIIRIEHVSAQWENVMGYSAELTLNDTEKTFDFIHYDDLPFVRQAIEHSAKTMTVFNVEYRLVIKGRIRWVQISSQPHLEDKFIVWDGIALNITKKKEAEMKLKQEKERLEVLGSNLPDVALYQFIIDLPTRQMNFSYVSGSWETITGVPVDIATHDVNAVFAAVHPDDLPQLLQAIGNIGKTSEKFYAEARIVVNGRIRCIQISASIRSKGKSLISDGTLLDITHRKEAERALEFERNRLQTLGDNLPGGSLFQFIRNNRTGQMRLSYVSAAWESVTGLQAEVALTSISRVFSYLYPEELPAFLRAIEDSALTMTDFNMEFRIGERWLHVIARPRSEDVTIIWDGIIFDITAKKEVYRALEDEKERLETLGNNFPNGILQRFVYNRKKYYMEYISSRWEEITGLAPELVYEDITPFFDIIHPEDRQIAIDATEASRKDMSDYDVEVRIIRKGIPRWIRIVSHPYLSGEKVVWDGIMIDITEQKNAEIALIDSEQKHRYIIENTQELFTIVDYNTHKFIFVAGYQLYGYSREEMMQQNLYTLFKASTIYKLADLIREKSEEYYKTGVIQSLTHREQLLHKEGYRFWAESSMQLIPDESGKLAYIIGVGRNIDEKVKSEIELSKYRKHLETMVEERTEELQKAINELAALGEELYASNEELEAVNEELVSSNEELHLKNEQLALITIDLQASNEELHWKQALLDAIVDRPISVTDMDMNITFLNQAALKIIGKTREEVIGRFCGDVWGAEICKDHRCGIECMKRGEGKSIFKVGDRTFTTTASYIKDRYDNNIGHIEVVEDITENI